MPDKDFIVKNGIVVNTAFQANSTQFQISSSSSNVTVNTSTIVVGNSVTSVSINSTSFSGVSNNSLNLGGQLPAFYTNASNITTGSLAPARLTGNYNITANNASFLGGVDASDYQRISAIATTVASLTSGNTTLLNNQPASFIQMHLI